MKLDYRIRENIFNSLYKKKCKSYRILRYHVFCSKKQAMQMDILKLHFYQKPTMQVKYRVT